MSFVNFLLEYYIYILVVIIILIVGVIGFLADARHKNKAVDKENNVQTNNVNQQPNNNNIVNEQQNQTINSLNKNTTDINSSNELNNLQDSMIQEPSPVNSVNLANNSNLENSENIVKILTEKTEGKDKDEIVLNMLSAVHDGWVKDNSKKFFARDKKYQHLPLELIGWKEVEADLLFIMEQVEKEDFVA